MNKTLIILFTVVSVFLLVVFTRALQLDLLTDPDKINAEELSQEEKIEDYEYFIKLVKDSYPFVEAIERAKDLDNFYKLEEHYRERILESKNNKEFISIIAEMVQRLEQGTAHCDIIAPGGMNNRKDIITDCIVYNVNKKGYYLREYWWNELDPGSKWTHARINTVYSKGNYRVTDTVRDRHLLIPAGSIVEMVNDKPVDEYVKSLQDKVWLRYDTHLEKVYSNFSPFLVDPDTLVNEWKVSFRLPDSSNYPAEIIKYKGYLAPPGVVYPEKNATCVELNGNTAYIKINAFLFNQARQADFARIDSFMQNSNGRYDKLIIDLRGNLGGAPRYWEDIFVKRLLKEPREFTQYSIVKKKVFNRLKFHRKLLALKYRKEIDLGRMKKIKDEEWPYELPGYIEPVDYYLLKNVKRYEPYDPFPFDGDIYLLTDNDTFSAAEDFTKAAKEMEFASIVGANTIGGAAVSFAPWVFQLPNSHIMISMEIDMAFNEDGSVNEIYGTRPDHVLRTSSYPTSMPPAYDAASLLEDPWINYILDIN